MKPDQSSHRSSPGVVHVLATELIEAELARILADVFERGDIAVHPDLTAADVEGWDSFRHLEIVAACEQRFGISFTSRELDGFRRLNDLTDAITRKSGGR